MAAPFFNYTPHPAQKEIHDARAARFRTVCCGRRFGKTRCMAAELIDRGAQDPGKYAWVAPTYTVADRGIDAFMEVARNNVRTKGRLPTRIQFDAPKGMTEVWFLSADNPENIRSFGFKGMVIDEAARVPLDVWQYILRPTLADKEGWAVFISTPRGRNWFYDMFTRGLDPLEKNYRSFQYPSNASPYFPADEWETSKKELPADVFRQEFLAEFLEDSAGVFRGVDAIILPKGTPLPIPRRPVVGIDIAKHTDYTVLLALDPETGTVIAMDRFNQLDWPFQKEKIVAFCRRVNGLPIIDSTGVGDAVYDDLKLHLPAIEGFRLTAVNKGPLIQRLMVAIEGRDMHIPAEFGVLIEELKRYEYEFTPSRGVTYNAPSGYHDDAVIALALAQWRRWECGHHGGSMFAFTGMPNGPDRPGPAVFTGAPTRRPSFSARKAIKVLNGC